MLEYFIYLAAFGIVMILFYCLVNRPYLIARIFRKKLSRDVLLERKRPYLEGFNEHKNGRQSIGVQVLPWIGVLALFFVLSNQYIAFALITTWSMEPTLHRGDLILMQTFDKSAKVGDIVIYGKPRVPEPITHRVVEVTKNGYLITKGDNNPTNDEPEVPPSRVAGKIILIGNSPIAISGAGYLIRPEKIGEFSILSNLPKTFVFAQAFEQLRTVSPLVLFMGTIFYFLLLLESRAESSHRFSRNRQNGRKGRNGQINGVKR